MTGAGETWQELRAFAHRLADASGAEIKRHFRRQIDVEDKHDDRGRSPVTDADRGAEEAIRTLIRTHYPDHGIFGEEHGRENTDARLTWVIDPIDGTKAFIAGFPTFGTLIGLLDDGEPLIGMLDQPILNERFVGFPGGATLGDAPLKTRHCPSLADARLCCTEPEMFADPAARAAFDALGARVSYRRYGGDCYAYAMLAAGFVDLVVEADLKPWDIIALIPIVEGAGGVVTGWDGGPAAERSQIIAAGTAALHAEARAILVETG